MDYTVKLMHEISVLAFENEFRTELLGNVTAY